MFKVIKNSRTYTKIIVIMCGRFSLTTDEAVLNERFRLAGGIEPYVARYNCAPTQNLAVIIAEEPLRLRFFRWGLIPFWAKDEKTGHKMINARAETLASRIPRLSPPRSQSADGESPHGVKLSGP